MFIHIGGEIVIPLGELIMIIDYSRGMEEKLDNLIQECEQLGNMIWISRAEPKSLVLTDKFVYASPKSPSTLKNKYMRLRLNEVNKNDHRRTLPGK